jgi:cellobiose phosphorylase
LFVQFEFTRTNGSVVVYNVETLVQYILATGDFSEPETRIPFSDEDLRRIDSEVDIPVSCAPSG